MLFLEIVKQFFSFSALFHFDQHLLTYLLLERKANSKNKHAK